MTALTRVFLYENVWLFCRAPKNGHINKFTVLPRWLEGGVSLHIYPEQNFITKLRLLPRAWDENFELMLIHQDAFLSPITYLNGNCFYTPSHASAFQYFLGNTSWGRGGGGLFTTGESGKYHYLLKTAALMVTTLSLVLCIICSYSIC